MLNCFFFNREKVSGEFEAFKAKSFEKESALHEDYERKLSEVSKKMEISRKDFEAQIRGFEELSAKFESEKKFLLEDLKSRHRLEIDSLKQSFSSHRETLQSEKNKLEEMHGAEIDALNKKLEELRQKNAQDSQDFEMNLTKLKLLHAKELDALAANSNNQFLANISELKNELEKARKEKLSSDNEHRRRFEEKIGELVAKDEEIGDLRDKLAASVLKIGAYEKNVHELSEEIRGAKSDSDRLRSEIGALSEELSALRKTCEERERMVKKKEGEIEMLESANSQKATVIYELKEEMDALKNRLSFLESERKQLENSNLNQYEVAMQQMKTLQKVS